MKSPFPGMDPYLEAHWRDVHARLVHGACNAIQRQLGGGLRARIDERLVVETDGVTPRSIYPDLRIFEKEHGRQEVSPAGGVALAEPLVVEIESEQFRETFIEIIDISSGGRVITVIEFVSPSNKKEGDGRRKYQIKQEEALAADINMVEIDLTRDGKRELLYPSVSLPPAYRTPYLACVRRGFDTSRFEIYRIPLRERLPVIRIPLRKTDPDVVLDLQALIDQAYDDGRYDDIDYRLPCVPALDPEDQAWAREVTK